MQSGMFPTTAMDCFSVYPVYWVSVCSNELWLFKFYFLYALVLIIYNLIVLKALRLH